MKMTPLIIRVPNERMRWLYWFGKWWSNYLSVKIMYFGVFLQHISSHDEVKVSQEDIDKWWEDLKKSHSKV